MTIYQVQPCHTAGLGDTKPAVEHERIGQIVWMSNHSQHRPEVVYPAFGDDANHGLRPFTVVTVAAPSPHLDYVCRQTLETQDIPKCVLADWTSTVDGLAGQCVEATGCQVTIGRVSAEDEACVFEVHQQVALA